MKCANKKRRRRRRKTAASSSSSNDSNNKTQNPTGKNPEDKTQTEEQREESPRGVWVMSNE